MSFTFKPCRFNVSIIHSRAHPCNMAERPYLIFRLLPIWAEKPVLMAVTERLDPHELHVRKYRRFSPLLSSVSGDLHVLHVTYSTVALLADCTPPIYN